MFRALVDATDDGTWVDDESAGDVFLGLAQTFRELAAAVDAFGELVRDESDPAKRMGPADVQKVREAHEARARLDEVLMAGSAPELLELHAAVLSTVKRLLSEMDLDERIRRQVRMLRRPRPRTSQPNAPTPTNRPTSQEPTADAETELLPKFPDDPWDRRRPRP
jgi:hypothetical protein